MNKTINDAYQLEFMNRSPATIAVETSILLLIGLIAIGGNLLVIISIYRNPSLRIITNYFVLSLAVTDTLYPTTTLPLTLASSIKSRFLLGVKMCEFQTILFASLAAISVLIIILMSINRFVCVCKPQEYKKVFNKITSLLMIGAIWVVSFVSAALYVKGFRWKYVRFSYRKMLCVPLNEKGSPNMSAPFQITALVLFIAVPLGIIIFCYFKVFKKIRQHKRNIAPASNPNSLGTSVQEIKVTWIMFAVLIGYCLTWVPLFNVLVAEQVCGRVKCIVPRQAYLIIPFAALSSSAINPVIYGAMNTAFRREYTKVLRCR